MRTLTRRLFLCAASVAIFACNAQSPSTPTSPSGALSSSPSCGNNKREAGEACDGTDVVNYICSNLAGFASGTLACKADCSGFDTSGCVKKGVCGDSVTQAPEVCDGADLGGQTCTSIGFQSGSLACKSDCSGFVLSGCSGGQCTPQCGSRVCGADPVCGSSCGTCTSGSCNASGACVSGGSGGDAPIILNLSSNVQTITAADTLIISAVVTHPDGIAQIVGGILADPSAGTYGSFQVSTTSGAYSLSLAWTAINTVETINAPSGGVSRTFRATFYDQSGHSTSQDLSVQLGCAQTNDQICAATCTILDSDPQNCGTCGNQCDSGICESGQCVVVESTTTLESCDDLCASNNMSCYILDGNAGLIGTFPFHSCSGPSSLPEYYIEYCYCE